MLWIILAISAASIQAFRNLEQKFLNKKLDTLTVTWSRFLLPLPAAIAVVFCSFSLVSNQFILHCVITAFFQIGGNFLLLRVVQSKNFSIGVAFYKTETLQSLLLGILIFEQKISTGGLVAILITTIGMFLMSNLNLKKLQFDKAAFLGALSGACFSISAFNSKFASEQLNLAGYSDYKAGMLTLMWVITLQNLIFITTKSFQRTLIQDLKNLLVSENRSSFFKMSSLSFVGSTFWFTAFAIGEVVYVKAVGQIEVVIALLISLHLKEKHKTREFAGIFFTAIGIITLILSQK